MRKWMYYLKVLTLSIAAAGIAAICASATRVFEYFSAVFSFSCAVLASVGGFEDGKTVR